MLVRLVRPENAKSPMVVRLFPRVMLVRPVQPLNASCPMVVRLSGRVWLWTFTVLRTYKIWVLLKIRPGKDLPRSLLLLALRRVREISLPSRNSFLALWLVTLKPSRTLTGWRLAALVGSRRAGSSFRLKTEVSVWGLLQHAEKCLLRGWGYVCI